MAACASLGAARAVPMSAVQPDRQALGAWLHLASAPGLTTAAGEALLRAFASIDALFGAGHAALAAIAGEAAARAVLAPPRQPDAAIDAVLEWLARSGGHLITRHDPAYPPRLATLYDPPPLLYVKGDPARLLRRGVAIVGSRLGTVQGRLDAVHFARALADAGLVVVSGLARGIDAAAHRGALGGAAGTVAVVGTGLDRVYPAAHHALAHEIVEHGALLSEWPLGTPARAANFPQRNRLIAALCDGVLVVEAAPRSGSLITARVANEMGRDVFALPGSIHAPLARGCHALIRDGAKLVETPADVLEEFGIVVASDAPAQPPEPHEPAPRRRTRRGAGTAAEPARDDATAAATAAAPPEPAAPLPPAALALLDALGHGPVPADLLAARSGVNAGLLPHLLLQLELAGRVACLPGDRFQRLDTPPAAAAPATPVARPVLHSGDRAQSAPSSPSKEPQCPR